MQYFLYVPVFGRIFPNAASFAAKPLADKLVDTAGMRAVAAQVVLDQCVHHPLLYFPSFYATRELIEHGVSWSSVQAALAKYRANCAEDMVALWKVWVPVTLVNFAFSPMWLRIPVVASTSLAWTCILSAMRGASSEVEADPEMAMDAVGNQLRALSRLVTHTRAVLDLTKTHIVLTAAGQRQSGMLHELSEVILKQAGNVVESRAMQLGSDLTLMMLIEVDPAQSAALHVALAEHQRLMRDVHLITRTTTPDGSTAAVGTVSPAPSSAAQRAEQRPARFQLASLDRPGLVHLVTKFFAAHDVDVLDMKCEQRDAFLDGKMQKLFFMEGLLAGDAPGTKAFHAALAKLEGACCHLRVYPSPFVSLTRLATTAESGVSIQLTQETGQTQK